MMKFVVLVIVCIVALNVFSSDDDDEVARRPLTETRSTTAPVVTPPQPRKPWTNHLYKDAMSDFENSVWTTKSLGTIPGTIGLPTTPILIARCVNNRTSVLVDWERYITSGGVDNNQSVTTRIDSRPAQKGTWSMSTDFEATFAPNGIALLNSMAGASSLLAETIPYGSSTVQAEFDISGADDVISDISSRCSWSR